MPLFNFYLYIQKLKLLPVYLENPPAINKCIRLAGTTYRNTNLPYNRNNRMVRYLCNLLQFMGLQEWTDTQIPQKKDLSKSPAAAGVFDIYFI